MVLFFLLSHLAGACTPEEFAALIAGKFQKMKDTADHRRTTGFVPAIRETAPSPDSKITVEDARGKVAGSLVLQRVGNSNTARWVSSSLSPGDLVPSLKFLLFGSVPVQKLIVSRGVAEPPLTPEYVRATDPYRQIIQAGYSRFAIEQSQIIFQSPLLR